MNAMQLGERLWGLKLGGALKVRKISTGRTLSVWFDLIGSGRRQRVFLRMEGPHLVLRSRIGKLDEVDLADDADLWILRENAVDGLGAVVRQGSYLCLEISLLFDHMEDDELALALEAVAVEADALEAKVWEGGDYY